MKKKIMSIYNDTLDFEKIAEAETDPESCLKRSILLASNRIKNLSDIERLFFNAIIVLSFLYLGNSFCNEERANIFERDDSRSFL